MSGMPRAVRSVAMVWLRSIQRRSRWCRSVVTPWQGWPGWAPQWVQSAAPGPVSMRWRAAVAPSRRSGVVGVVTVSPWGGMVGWGPWPNPAVTAPAVGRCPLRATRRVGSCRHLLLCPAVAAGGEEGEADGAGPDAVVGGVGAVDDGV